MRPGFWELLLIIVLVLLLFGHNKIPAMMKNIAEGLNVFKSELNKDKKPAEKQVVAEKKVATKAVKPAVKKTVKKTTAKKRK